MSATLSIIIPKAFIYHIHPPQPTGLAGSSGRIRHLGRLSLLGLALRSLVSCAAFGPGRLPSSLALHLNRTISSFYADRFDVLRWIVDDGVICYYHYYLAAMRCSLFISKMQSLPCVIELIAAESLNWRAPNSASGSFQVPTSCQFL